MSASPAPNAPDNARRSFESLLAFWADAGVDALYVDAPVDRTLARRPPLAPKSVVPPTALARDEAPRVLSPNLEQARRIAAEALDGESLKAVATAFLGLSAPVFWRGGMDAAVVVIGEAPSAEDEAAAAPFSGAAGRLLDRMLQAAGLTGRALMVHTVFARPPGDRTPTAEEQALTAPLLERLIALAAPRALLLAGAGSAKAMLGRSEPILSLHGRWLEWRSADGAQELPALPTLSPTFLLRQPLAKRKSWNDLLTLSERIDRPHRP